MPSPFRQLARDSAIYGISTVVQRLLTFLLTPLYTNVLAPAELGDVAQLYSLMALAMVLATVGFEPAFMRYWVESPSRKRVLTHAFGGVVASVALVCGGGALAAPAIARVLALSSASAAALVHMACAVVALDGLAAIPFALLRMQRRAAVFATLRVVAVVVNVALNVVFVVQWGWGVEGVMRAAVVSSLVAAVLAVPMVVRQLEWTFDAALLGSLVRFGVPTVPAALAAMVVQVADRPLLGWLAGPAAVGIYNANYRLAIPMMLAVSVFETAWRPLYLHHADDPKIGELLVRALRYFLAVAVVLFALVTLFIGDIVAVPIGTGHLIGSAYWEGLPIVPIVMAGYIALGITTAMAASLHVTKRTVLLPAVHGVAAVANVALNLVLIPQLGYVGAAWATVGAYAIGAVATTRAAVRVLPIRYPWRAVVIAACVCGAIDTSSLLLPLRGMLAVKGLAVLAAAGCAILIARQSPNRQTP
jgi:O-antigen/teichoic acid export membrane protein